MESIHTNLALYGSKNEFAMTDNVVFPISEVCDGTVSLDVTQFYVTKYSNETKGLIVIPVKNKFIIDILQAISGYISVYKWS